ncbi:MAG: recombinase family protein [Chloroflexi bacterium]|nr:recombinase family protein [Chloroflexota bacterium]
MNTDAVKAQSTGRQLRAAIYVRVSTQEQATSGYGLDDQLAQCRRLVADSGATIVGEYQDTESGTRMDLPGLTALLDDAERHRFNIVFCYDPDRLSRKLTKYVILEAELARLDVALRFVTVAGGDTPKDRAMMHMKAAFAEHDHGQMVARLKNGKRTKAEQGKYVGTGLPPYGYRYLLNEKGRAYALEEDPATGAIVRRIFRDVTVTSAHALCRRLTAEGVPTYFQHRAQGPAGRVGGWHPATLHGILHNPVYIGTAAYGRRRGAEKVWQEESKWIYSPVPALIDRATWDAAHAALDRRNALRQRSARTPENAARYELRGILKCGHCGGALQTAINGVANGMYRYYQCLRSKPRYANAHGLTPCPLPVVPAEPLEQIAWDEVVATLLDPERLREGIAAARAEHLAATGRMRRRIATLDGELGEQRARLSRMGDETLAVPAYSESAQLLREKTAQLEDIIGRLAAERAALAAEPAAGLSEQDANDLEAFAAEIRQGVANATAEERRLIHQKLQLVGVVYRDDQHGIKLKRRNRFSIEWANVLTLRRKDGNFVNVQSVWIGPAVQQAQPAPKQAAAVE